MLIRASAEISPKSQRVNKRASLCSPHSIARVEGQDGVYPVMDVCSTGSFRAPGSPSSQCQEAAGGKEEEDMGQEAAPSSPAHMPLARAQARGPQTARRLGNVVSGAQKGEGHRVLAPGHGVDRAPPAGLQSRKSLAPLGCGTQPRASGKEGPAAASSRDPKAQGLAGTTLLEVRDVPPSRAGRVPSPETGATPPPPHFL